MKKYLIILLAAVSFAVSCNSTKDVEEAPLPMFWTWLEDLPGVDMEATFAAMHEAGIDGVMLHAVTEEDYKPGPEHRERGFLDLFRAVARYGK